MLHLTALLLICLLQSPEDAAAAPGPPPALSIRQQRLQTHFAVFQLWMQQTLQLTPEQTARLQRLGAEEVTVAQEAWSSTPQTHRQQKLSDFAPIEFTGVSGAAECVSRTLLQFQIIGLLTDTQAQQLEAAEAERREWLEAGDRRYLVSVIDEQLQLTPDQQVLLEDEIRLNRVDSPLFSFDTADHPLTCISRLAVAARIHEIELTDVQRSKCVQLRLPQQSGQATLSCEVPASVDQLPSVLSELVRHEKSRCDQDVARRVAAFQRAWQLKPDQSARLMLAGKGATLKCLAAWKHSTEQQLQNAQQNFRGRAATLGLSAIPSSTLFEHPIWTTALEALRPAASADSGGRRGLRHPAISHWVLVTLDRELWLRPEQREPLRQLLQPALPEDVGQLTGPGRELAFLALPLFRVPPGPLADVLTAEQLQVWQLLQQQFVRDGQSLRIQRQNGEWFSIDNL